MARNLPPLAQLRSFEAAARFLSFKKAANHLHVTPSAISHAVQSLEDFLGMKLFHRVSSGRRQVTALVLTDAGKSLLPTLSRCFDDMEKAVVGIMDRGAADVLTVAIAPIFARSWLMPRLHRFVAAHPDVNIRINSTLDPTDNKQREFDVGLMYGRGDWPDLVSEMLLPENMVPVCSPALIQYDQTLDKPEDLAYHTLIHSEARLVNWAMWLENAGIHGLNPTKGLHFNRAGLAIDAAINGLGVVLEGRMAVQDEIEKGSLIIPFEVSGLSEERDGYYLTYPEGRGHITKVALFRNWVLKEAGMQ